MNSILTNRLAPFRHIGFRRFFFVQSLSLSGSWAADLARAWIILQLMGTAAALGGLLLCTALPGLFLILHGGVLVDRVNVRKLMMITKIGLGAISLFLAIIVEYGHIQYWHLLAFGLLEGLVNAFDAPAFQALTVRLVPKTEFQQALALNSINFHGARMLGPAIAGILMAWHGPSAVFLFDAITYFILVGILNTIDLNATQRKVKEFQGQWKSLVAGIRYIWSSQKIRFTIAQLLLTISLIYPLLIVVFRTFIKAKFQLDAKDFGLVFTLPALGSMTGALSFAALKPRFPLRALIAGVPGVTLMILLVPRMPTPILAAATMALAGFFMYLTFASLTVSVQLDVEEEFRGRISSVIGLCFVSIGPLLGLPLGWLADRIGFQVSIEIMTSIFLALSFLLAALHHKNLRSFVK